MERLIIFGIAMLCSFGISAQQEKTPFSFGTEYKFDVINNLSGGLKTGTGYVGRVDLTVTFNTKDAGWYKGGTFFVHGINVHGSTPSSTLVGDIQPVSRIEASERTVLFEFWYRQNWERVSLMLGQLDMNALMATNASSGNFLNTSFGMYPSVALNAPLSIYPRATAGVYSQLKTTENTSVRLAVFDGQPLSFDRNPHNIKWDIQPKRGLFYTSEFEFNNVKEGRLTGTYKAGVYIHTTEAFDLTDSTNVSEGGNGFYVSADQQIISEKDDATQGMNIFFQAGSSPGKESFVNFYGCAGISYTGAITGRNADVLGMGVVYSAVNQKMVDQHAMFTNNRVLVEAFYKAKLGNHFLIQPDLQYIINTGAMKSLENCFIGVVRGAITF